MKVNSKELLQALKKVSVAVSTNKIIPILEYVKIECHGTSATVTATNLNLTVACEFELLESSKDSMLLPFDVLEKKAQLTHEMEIKVDKFIKIKFGKEWDKLGVPEDVSNFTLPVDFTDPISLDVTCDFFFSMTQALKSTESNSSLANHNVYIDIKKDHMMIVSAGMASVFFNKTEIKSNKEIGVVVPPEFIKACKYLQDAKIEIFENKIRAYDGINTITCSLSEFKMLGYRVVYNREKEPNVTINKNDLLTAIYKVESNRTTSSIHQAFLYFSDNEIKVKSYDNDLDNEGEYFCPCVNNSPAKEIMFSSNVLKSAISQINSDVLNIRFTDEKTAIAFTDGNTTVFTQPLTFKK